MDLISSKDWRIINETIYKMNAEQDPRKAMEVFLRETHSLIEFERASILLYNVVDDQYEVECFIADNVSDKAVSDYEAYYYQMDDVMKHMHKNIHEISRSTDVFDYKERMKTEFYEDFTKPYGAHYSIDGGFFWNKNYLTDGFGTFDLFRSHTDKDFSDKDVEICRILSPHLSNKAGLYISSLEDLITNEFRGCRFTKTELDVAKLILLGYENESIANMLGSSVSTVKHHVSNIFQKAAINSKLEFVSAFNSLGKFNREERLTDPEMKNNTKVSKKVHA